MKTSFDNPKVHTILWSAVILLLHQSSDALFQVLVESLLAALGIGLIPLILASVGLWIGVHVIRFRRCKQK